MSIINTKIKIQVYCGQVIGNLTILEEIKPRYFSSGKKDRRVRVKCVCGKIYEVSLATLTRKRHIVSCGCLNKYSEYVPHSDNTFLGRDVHINQHGYPIICIDGTNKYVHVLQMERILGRPLKDSEVVHHLDGNKLNFKFDNLLCFRTSSDHTAFHNGVPYVLDKEGVAYCPTIGIDLICPQCGGTKSRHAQVCDTCYTELFRKNHGIYKPNRDKLKKDLLLRNYKLISQMYNVTDNSVRKWCKSYNLPVSTKYLKSLTDEEILNL